MFFRLFWSLVSIGTLSVVKGGLFIFFITLSFVLFLVSVFLFGTVTSTDSVFFSSWMIFLRCCSLGLWYWWTRKTVYEYCKCGNEFMTLWYLASTVSSNLIQVPNLSEVPWRCLLLCGFFRPGPRWLLAHHSLCNRRPPIFLPNFLECWSKCRMTSWKSMVLVSVYL